MGLMWILNTFVFMLFVSVLYCLIILMTGFLITPLKPQQPQYDKVILPYNLKGQPATKERWARRTQQQDNSFANAIMWADLGND